MYVYIIIIPTYTYTKRTYRQGNNGNPIDGTPPNINCAPRPKDLRFVFDVSVCVCSSCSVVLKDRNNKTDMF